MTNVVNLRMARKRRDRALKEQAASENRALHGRPKAERQRDRIEAERAADFIDGHRRDRTDPQEPR
ncbi:DUF4169 family protein [Mesorhizobium marinum]|uniref:DUF4169 family protein n=1 Tax=Mesorhizobium marinum TaxID=3228790 RepID=UPI003466E6A4